jgi:hypothetical protein
MNRKTGGQKQRKQFIFEKYGKSHLKKNVVE